MLINERIFQELYCYVLEDSQQFPEMLSNLEAMYAIRQLRESAMRTINRHSSVVLDCGTYCSHAPAPNPILPFDTCSFHFPSFQLFTLSSVRINFIQLMNFPTLLLVLLFLLLFLIES